MPYDFVASGADDITFSTTTTAFADNRTVLVCGWWRPTTAVAGSARLWSFGNVMGAHYDTTDRLNIITQNATTNGSWHAASCGFVTDEWLFVAVLASTENTGVLNALRVWTGTISTAPEARTVSVTTTPVGNFTGSASFYIGARGTVSNLAWGGQIADVSVMVTDASYGVTAHPFGLATSGVITDAEARLVYERLVLPLWLGDTSVLWRYENGSARAAYHIGLDGGATVVGNTRGSATVMPSPAVTINGATWSQEGAPRPRLTPAMWPDLVM
jgi:hypothetical protein